MSSTKFRTDLGLLEELGKIDWAQPQTFVYEKEKNHSSLVYAADGSTLLEVERGEKYVAPVYEIRASATNWTPSGRTLCEDCGGEGFVDLVFKLEDPCRTCGGSGTTGEGRIEGMTRGINQHLLDQAIRMFSMAFDPSVNCNHDGIWLDVEEAIGPQSDFRGGVVFAHPDVMGINGGDPVLDGYPVGHYGTRIIESEALDEDVAIAIEDVRFHPDGRHDFIVSVSEAFEEIEDGGDVVDVRGDVGLSLSRARRLRKIDLQ